MTRTDTRLVGDSFRLGYRLQGYWGTSMAIAFFSAEVGAGTFLLALYHDHVPGMILGLLLAATLKPYFHLAHMGVPQKSWRAVIRPDRSWISRGAIAIGLLVGFGVLYVVDRGVGLGATLGLPAYVGTVAKYVAVAAGVVVCCYQGMAMAASESFTLWASPLVPVSSACYSATAGALTLLAIGWEALEAQQRAGLATLIQVLLLLDLAVVAGILLHAGRKSPGGAFSVELLLKGELAAAFRNLVVLTGLAAPLVLVAFGGAQRLAVVLAWIAMLAGFYTFRASMFRAAVFEPITHDLAGSIGLPGSR
ncbi:MAG: dimethyl sulfoxide reductase anchor subunit [Burkholderiaceae bacterium]|nr:dimethyl sulfoxide reductase anchor subunit [Burkholderiaceae bacterium]